MATFTVTNTNNSGAGSLRQAITNANALTGEDIINFSGLFDDGLAHTISLTGGGLSITDDITIPEYKDPSLLTISADSASPVFDITSGASARIYGLTITNSYNGVTGGGGIYNEGSLGLYSSIITGNTVTNNTTNYNSVGLRNNGTATLAFCTISGYDFGIENSLLPVDNNSLSLNYSTVTDNSNDGIRINSGLAVVRYSTISHNSGAGFSLGVGGRLFIDNSTISHNDDSGISSYSGILSYSLGTSITVNDSIISDNSTARYGGGIYNASIVGLTGGSITLNNTIMSGNTAGIAGGGIYSDGPTTLNNSTITDNSAVEGGGIYNYGRYYDPTLASGGTLSVNCSTISYNYAATGGGIYNNNTLKVSNSNINNNYANNYGGGIYNSSSNGNGIQTQLGNVTVSYSSISDNTAGIAGGGIYNNADDGGDYTGTVRGNQLGIVNVGDSTISGNQAHFGAGIYNDGTLTVGNSTIKHNKAFGIELSCGGYEFGDGGGIYNNFNYGTTTVEYSAIACNFDTCQEDSNNRIQPDDIAGNFINNGYNWIGINTATTTAGDAA